MGTRADYFIGIGPNAEWLGSTTFDGNPHGVPCEALGATSEAAFRERIEALLADPEITSTRPAEGWPWPWDDHRTTDYAYAWDPVRNDVVISQSGRQWERPEDHDARRESGAKLPKLLDDEVVNMKARKADTETILKKSGLIILGQP